MCLYFNLICSKINSFQFRLISFVIFFMDEDDSKEQLVFFVNNICRRMAIDITLKIIVTGLIPTY